ncbi:MAG: methyltransferase domain-containing protein [Opitutae bacterium]|nr:methyltransferase domain-containing protein [Opitutae bacterium]
MKPVGESELLEFRALIARRLGLWFDDHRRDFLASVLSDRTAAQRCADPVSYLRGLDGAAWRDEWTVLAGTITITETYFLRGPEHFRALAETVLTIWQHRDATVRPLRLLSAGCSSGEEAFSLAIALREQAPWLDQWRVEIVGIDANREMLAKARQGRFGVWSLRETPPALRERYFRPAGPDFMLDDKIRTMVSFVERNLAEANDDLWQPAAFDVVFCRNMLMYFTPEAAEALVRRIQRALVPSGFLFLGHAETLRGLSRAFRLCQSHGAFYYQLGSDVDVGRPDSFLEGEAIEATLPASRPAPVAGTNWFDEIGRAAAKIETLSSQASRRPCVGPAPAPNCEAIGRALDLHRQERFAEALAQLQSCLSGAATDPDLQVLQAVLLVNCGRTDEAEALCRPLLGRLDAGAHYVAALCREHAGDYAPAADHAATAAYLDSQFAMPRFHLGLICKRQGREREALGHFQEALALLVKEDPARLLLFGGGFTRETLVQACRAEIRRLGGES